MTFIKLDVGLRIEATFQIHFKFYSGETNYKNKENIGSFTAVRHLNQNFKAFFKLKADIKH